MKDWPAVDHSFLSPSGKISKRARDKYLREFAKQLFPKELFPDGIKGYCKQPSEKEKLVSQIKRLRELANSGMSTKKYTKEANRLEELLNQIENVK